VQKLLERSEWLIDLVSTLLVWISLLAISIQIFCRYFLGNATTWSDTVAATALAWMTFLAGSSAVRKNENIAADFFAHYLSPSLQRIFKILSNLVVICFALCLGYSGLMLIEVSGTSMVEGFGFDLTWSSLYSICVTSGVLILVFSIEKLFILLKDNKT
jgi:TRAP-type C4-dicarboxylate transport system permease small subunit